ncbi:MAG: 2OG-Fe(II) oxygenase [Archangium sp.]
MTLSDAEVAQLGRDGWFTRDQFLEPSLAKRLHDEAPTITLRRAGVRREAQLDASIRSDELAWITREDAVGAFRDAGEQFASLMDALNQSAWLGLRDFDLQLARYQPGAKYVRHRDAFPGDDNRRLTAIVYLNPAWEPAHGGQLRMHLEPPIDVEPRLNRLVVFRSELVEHEVLPAFSERWALTAWYSAKVR